MTEQELQERAEANVGFFPSYRVGRRFTRSLFTDQVI